MNKGFLIYVLKFGNGDDFGEFDEDFGPVSSDTDSAGVDEIAFAGGVGVSQVVEVGIGHGEEAGIDGIESTDAEEWAGEVDNDGFADPFRQGCEEGVVGSARFCGHECGSSSMIWSCGASQAGLRFSG